MVAALACGVMLERSEEIEKKPAEATAGAKSPQDDPLAKSKYTAAFLSFSPAERGAWGEGVSFFGNKRFFLRFESKPMRF